METEHITISLCKLLYPRLPHFNSLQITKLVFTFKHPVRWARLETEFNQFLMYIHGRLKTIATTIVDYINKR